jgi:hypothetical protein
MWYIQHLAIEPHHAGAFSRIKGGNHPPRMVDFRL